MTDAATPLRIAAVGDVHVGEAGSDTLADIVAEVSQSADALVLCGDITDNGKPSEADIAAKILRSCRVPVVAVLGNHDHECNCAPEVSSILTQAGVHMLDGSSHVLGDVAFVGVKGFAGGFGRRMLGSFGEPAIKAFVAETLSETLKLENAMRKVRARRTLVVLHYAPVVDTVEGEPLEIYPFLGSSRLAETIDRFDVDAVVHGHAHTGRPLGRTPRGVPVYNVAWAIQKPDGRPYAIIEL